MPIDRVIYNIIAIKIEIGGKYSCGLYNVYVMLTAQMNSNTKGYKKRKTLIFIGVIILVIGISVGAALGFNKVLNKRDSNDKDNSDIVVSADNNTALEASAKAEEQAFNGDLEGGLKTYDRAINSVSDSEAKASLYSNKATLLFNNGDYDQALKMAQQAYSLNSSPGYAAFIGQIARAKGDTTMALEYYKKARDSIDFENNPMAEFDEEYYSSIIAELGG